jgi:hypothetical protein
MNTLSSEKVGLVFGIFFGAAHIMWSLLVFLGWGQALVDFAFTMHMVAPVFIIGQFDISKAAALVVLASGIGYCFGLILATIWNKIQRF